MIGSLRASKLFDPFRWIERSPLLPSAIQYLSAEIQFFRDS